MFLPRWYTIGSIATAAIAALIISLLVVPGVPGRGSFASTFGLRESATGSIAAGTSTSSNSIGSSSAGASIIEVAGTSGEGIGPAGAGSGAVPVAPTQSTAEQFRLRIPALAVDARVTSLGFDGNGGFAVPTTASAVGWYEFSAWPGSAGNAVLGGHLNWSGSRGVFDRLDELSAGDLVYVDTPEGEIAYRVVGLRSVAADTPFAQILGERSGPSTLTLFTCGGTFNAAAGEYDHRVVVDAVRA
ncbi:MAG: class F sortase [Chloroflexi bacterium]|nr:class F sortase [Chloroflexota bacterium]MDA1146183.1 class F sortase [Chloroflexota bacterium]